MRLIHTGDWHLGRTLHEHSLIEDQRAWLAALADLAASWRPDAVIVAGDVYDRAVPPVEAVALLDEALARLVLDLGVPVVMIAGNHDSPGRLDFGASILAERGLHVRGTLRLPVEPIVLRDEHGPVRVYPVPHFEPAEVPGDDPEDALNRHDGAWARLAGEILGAHPAGERSVVAAHLYAAGGTVSDSERPLSVGGTEAVGPGRLSRFDYAALGHLHRPQRVEAFAHVRYAGSALKYSLSEHDQPKGVTLVEMDGAGRCRVEERALPVRRDLRRLRGTLADILTAATNDPRRDDYVFADLDDAGALYEPMARLREKYPHALAVRFAARAAGFGDGADAPPSPAPGRDLLDLFADFVREIGDRDLDADSRAVVASLLDELRRAERES